MKIVNKKLVSEQVNSPKIGNLYMGVDGGFYLLFQFYSDDGRKEKYGFLNIATGMTVFSSYNLKELTERSSFNILVNAEVHILD
jgi:hypothetical protein